jgi:hypothetical protein
MQIIARLDIDGQLPINNESYMALGGGNIGLVKQEGSESLVALIKDAKSA